MCDSLCKGNKSRNIHILCDLLENNTRYQTGLLGPRLSSRHSFVPCRSHASCHCPLFKPLMQMFPLQVITFLNFFFLSKSSSFLSHFLRALVSSMHSDNLIPTEVHMCANGLMSLNMFAFGQFFFF